MTAEKADYQHAVAILYQGNQAVVVGLDIEHDAPAFQDARLWMRTLHILRRTPVRSLHNRQPCPVLGACRVDALVTGMFGKVALEKISNFGKNMLVLKPDRR